MAAQMVDIEAQSSCEQASTSSAILNKVDRPITLKVNLLFIFLFYIYLQDNKPCIYGNMDVRVNLHRDQIF